MLTCEIFSRKPVKFGDRYAQICRPSPAYPFCVHFVTGKLSREIYSPADPPGSLEAALAWEPLRPNLAVALGTRFNVPGRSGRPSTKNPRPTGDPTGAKPDDGKALLGFLRNHVDRRAPGIQGVVFMGVAQDSTCVLVHSLFCVYDNRYADVVLWDVLGPLPTEGATDYVRLTSLHMAWGVHFVGVDRLDFESALS